MKLKTVIFFIACELDLKSNEIKDKNEKLEQQKHDLIDHPGRILLFISKIRAIAK